MSRSKDEVFSEIPPWAKDWVKKINELEIARSKDAVKFESQIEKLNSRKEFFENKVEELNKSLERINIIVIDQQEIISQLQENLSKSEKEKTKIKQESIAVKRDMLIVKQANSVLEKENIALKQEIQKIKENQISPEEQMTRFVIERKQIKIAAGFTNAKKGIVNLHKLIQEAYFSSGRQSIKPNEDEFYRIVHEVNCNNLFYIRFIIAVQNELWRDYRQTLSPEIFYNFLEIFNERKAVAKLMSKKKTLIGIIPIYKVSGLVRGLFNEGEKFLKKAFQQMEETHVNHVNKL